MKEEPVRKILRNVGLTGKETDVYIFLAKKGALKGAEIAKATSTDKAEIYRILKSLQRKGLLQATLEVPTRFITVPFNQVIDSFIKARRDEAALVASSKDDLLKDWERISRISAESGVEKFVVIKGDDKIYPRILQLVKDTQNQLSVVLSVHELLRADQFGLFEAALGHPHKSKLQFYFLTELSKNSSKTMKILLQRITEGGLNFSGRSFDLGLRLSSRMVIRDDEEILLFITSRNEKKRGADKEEVCLWTNCKALVQSFTHAFEEMWGNSTDISRKIIEVETGRASKQAHVIFDAKKIDEEYDAALNAAKDEIDILTSSKGLLRLSQRAESLRKLSATQGVSIKIMAPIVRENFVSSRKLSEYCEVRHVSENNLTTILIDGHSLFQFRDSDFDRAKREVLPCFETAFYSDDFKHLEKAKSILDNVWRNSQALSEILPKSTGSSAPCTNPLSDVLGQSSGTKMLLRVEEYEEGTVTEKEVVDKLVNAKRVIAKNPLKDINVQYGSFARGLIRPPSYFNLPDLVIQVWHCNKQSSWGAEDWLEVYLWLETPKGFAFVPVSHVTDNPRAAEFRKGVWAGTPAERNIIVAKKDKLQVRVQSSTLFAGWTIPIPLHPPQNLLPPCCILFEGYGKLKSGRIKTSLPSGKTQITEFNGFEAFVTFFHPSSKYSGPGTDGMFNREHIMTAYPPPATK